MKPMVANITNGYDVLPLPRKNSTNYVKTLKKKCYLTQGLQHHQQQQQ
jgi:hypothetical protein